MAVTITEQLACVERELRLRRRVYGRWVQQNKLTAAKADQELEAMQAVWDSLCWAAAMRIMYHAIKEDPDRIASFDFDELVERVRAAARSGQDVDNMQPDLFT